MDYEPTGKAKLAIEAMLAAPNRIFTSEDLAKLMAVTRSAVPAYMEPAVRHGLVFRNTAHGALQFAGSRFSEQPTLIVPPGAVKVDAPAPAPWAPKPMIATRPGSEQPRKTLAAPAPAPALEIPTFLPATTPAPAVWTAPPCPIEITEPVCRPAPSTAECREIPIEEIDQHDIGADEEAEAAEPDAFVSCRTGEIVLIGLEPDEEGRVVIPADLVSLIKRQIAWSAPR